MSGLQEKVEKAIIETLQAYDGAGSDCCAGDVENGWMEIHGYIDIPHLASDLIRAITGE